MTNTRYDTRFKKTTKKTHESLVVEHSLSRDVGISSGVPSWALTRGALAAPQNPKSLLSPHSHAHNFSCTATFKPSGAHDTGQQAVRGFRVDYLIILIATMP